jgi:hypothetical protein
MTPRSLSMPLFWKTLLVGGIFGYLLAVITLTINGSSTSSLKSPPWRFLEEEETSSIVEEGEGRAEGKHHEEELDVVRNTSSQPKRVCSLPCSSDISVLFVS